MKVHISYLWLDSEIVMTSSGSQTSQLNVLLSTKPIKHAGHTKPNQRHALAWSVVGLGLLNGLNGTDMNRLYTECLVTNTTNQSAETVKSGVDTRRRRRCRRRSIGFVR